MKNQLLLIVLSIVVSVSTYAKNTFILSTDLTYSSARELWFGNSDEVTFQDSEMGTHPNGSLRDAKASYWNYGLEGRYHLSKLSLEASLRLDYTMSRMKDGSTPSLASGAEGAAVNQLSGLTLKLSKRILKRKKIDLTGYFEYRNPIESDPANPTFIAVNDFATHLSLGFKSSFTIMNKLYAYLDAKYTKRSTADTFETDELPADQVMVKLDFLYAYDDKFSFGSGLTWKHTFSGLQIASPAFGAAIARIGHVPFYATRERFVGHSLYFNYYLNSKTWMGVSQFQKFWGRNTDRSRSTTVFAGRTF